MKNVDENHQEKNEEAINTDKKEEEKEQNSNVWVIEGWNDPSSTFTFTFKLFQDVFHFTTKNEDDKTFEILIELEHPYQSNLFFVAIIIQNKDEQNLLRESKSVTFMPDIPNQKIIFPINCNQMTEENGFLFDGNLHITIDVINLRKPSTQPLIIPIINSTQQQTQSTASQIPAPYSGLKNQGSTCYMNSILQSLYHIPLFKYTIYSLDTKSNDTSDDKNIPLNLQRLFGLMQLTPGPCSTFDLTKSFGWDAQEIIMQHDAQEFCRKFLDNLEMKMRGTSLENAIPSLFKGKMLQGIRCRNVPFESMHEEAFYDISLDVNDSSTLEESFQKIIENDPLIGDNQYDAGPDFGKQDADITTEYVEFPRVLHLHLRRFMFDPNVNNYVKVNKKFSFPETIDLAPYMSHHHEGNPMLFELFGVLVHWGTFIGGHYIAYIRTTKEKKWYEFNDTKVTEVSPEVAIDGNFGGPSENQNQNDNSNQPVDKLYSAYMLIYVKKDAIDEVFKEVSNDEVPEHIVRYMHQKEEEEKALAQAQYEKENTMNTPIIVDKVIEIFAQNNELKINIPYSYDEPSLSTSFEIKKYDTFKTVYEKCSKLIGRQIGSFILFPIAHEKLCKALPITEKIYISSLNPLPNGFLFRKRDMIYMNTTKNAENETSSEDNPNENEEEEEAIEDEKSNENNETERNEDKSSVENENSSIENSNELTFNEEETNLLFVLCYFRTIKRFPLHFAFTKEVHQNDTLSDLYDDFRSYFKLQPDCKLASFRGVSAYQVEPFNNENLSILVQRDTGPFLVIQPIDSDVNVPCCYTYRDMTMQNYDEEEDEEEYVSYVNNYMKMNPFTVIQYMTCHYSTAQISIQTQNGHKILIVPYIVSFRELKLFAADSFSLDYNDKFDCMLIFPQNRRQFIISPDGNDDSLSIADLIHNLNAMNNSQQNDQLSFKLFVLNDTSIECFFDMALFEITNTLDPNFEQIYQILPKTLTYDEATDIFSSFANHANEPIRLMTVLNRKIYWLKGSGCLIDVVSPIKLEIVPISQRNLEPTDALISVLQFKIACYPFMPDKNAFNRIDDGDPYLFKLIKDEKFVDMKMRILDERRIPIEIHKNLHFFILNPSTEEKEHLLVDDDILTDLVKCGSTIYFGPTNNFNTNNYRAPRESSIKIYN